MNVQSVILAAGLSARMGRNKMLLPLGGKTVIERCVGAFYDSCSKIIVVTGKYDREIRQVLRPYRKVICLYNPDYERGMFESVKAGVGEVDSERFFITPGDYPLLKTETIRSMLRIDSGYVQPVYRGKRGHPLLLHKAYIPIISGSKSQSLRQCLNNPAYKKQSVEVDDIGIITDMDTMEAYQAVLKRLGYCPIAH